MSTNISKTLKNANVKVTSTFNPDPSHPGRHPCLQSRFCRCSRPWLQRTGVVGAKEAGAAWGAGVVQHEVARAGRGSEVVGHVVVGTSAGAGQGVWVVGPELIGVDVAWCRI